MKFDGRDGVAYLHRDTLSEARQETEKGKDSLGFHFWK